MKYKNLISVAIGLFIAGITFVCIGVTEFYRSQVTPEDFNMLTADELKNNLIVEGDLYYNYGAFVEEYTTKYGIQTSSSKFTYLIPVGEYEFMGIQTLNNEMESSLKLQTDETFSYLLEETYLEPQPIHIKGRIKKLDSQSLGFMKEYLMEMGFTLEEANTYCCPYYIYCEQYDSWYVAVGIGVVILLPGILCLIIFIVLERKRKKNFISAMPANPELGAGFGSSSYSTSTFTPYEPSTTTNRSDIYGTTGTYNTSTDNASQSDSSSDISSEENASNFSFKLEDD